MARKSKEEVLLSETFTGSDGLTSAILNARERVGREGEQFYSVEMSGRVSLVRIDDVLHLKITEE